MTTEVRLPNLGDGVDEGDVLEVFVKEGEIIAKDQGIIELETGKATVQVPSSHAGKVLRVHVKSGQTIPSGSVLLTLEEAAVKAAAGPEATQPAPSRPAVPSRPAAPQPPPPSPPPPPPPTAQVRSPAEQDTPTARPTTAAGQPNVVRPAAASSPGMSEKPAKPGGEIAAGPAIRRFAREVGVDLASVSGSGAEGRITRDDVLAVVRSNSQPPPGNGSKAKANLSTQRDAWGPVRLERATKIRKTIAAKMHESWTTVPRVTNFDDADVTELERIRSSSKDDYAKKGIKLTSLPFVIKAVSNALKNHPVVNASLDLANDQIIYKEYINIGIAVDTDRGLVVPGLRGADEMSIPEIARGLARIADNVRDGNFTPADLQGNSFTISNLGAIGGTYSTPIVNTPEVAILLVGRSRKLPVVVDDQVVPRLMMPLSLSYDHRLVDGAAAARFLNEVIDYLESPSRLLLAI